MMNQEKYNKFDILIRLLTLLTIIFGGIFAYFKYENSKEQALREAYWNKQLSYCQKGSEIATKLVNDVTDHGTTLKSDTNRLYQMVFGEAGYLLTDLPLDTLGDIMRKGISCRVEKNCDSQFFNREALKFTQLCREMLAESWNKSLNSIDDGRKWLYLD